MDGPAPPRLQPRAAQRAKPHRPNLGLHPRRLAVHRRHGGDDGADSTSYAFACFLLALAVRAVIFPLAQKQIMFGRQMSQPAAGEGHQRPVQGRPSAEANEGHGAVQGVRREPAGRVQARCSSSSRCSSPYQCMLLYQFDFTRGTFLDFNSVSSAATNGFFAPNLGQPRRAADRHLRHLHGRLDALTPISDPTQIRTQRLMGVGMSVFFTVTMFFGIFLGARRVRAVARRSTNLLATAQALRAYRLPNPPSKVNASGGGVPPMDFPEPLPLAATASRARTAKARWTAGRRERRRSTSRKSGSSGWSQPVGFGL